MLHGLTAALVATMVAQVLATLSVFVLPVLAPIAAASLGMPPHLVGYQVAVIYAGAASTSLATGWLIARFGAAGSTQIAMVAGALGTAGIASGQLALVVAGSALVGVGYGITNPAATQVLNRLAPPARRNLIFSIKQMGVPIGGTLAGLALPTLGLALGWRGAALGVAIALALATIALHPFRAVWDAPREDTARAAPKMGTFAALRAGRGLVALAVMGALFSATQLSLGAYAVTMLVGEFGWGAVAAGAAAAAIQASGAVARLLWAMAADRLSAGLAVLASIGLGTAAAALLMPFALHWPAAMVILLLCVFGGCTAGWTGVAMAEVARLAPPGAAGAAAGGVLSVTFCGVVFGPLVYAGIVTLIGSYTDAFAVMAALPLAGAAIAWRAHRRAGPA
jgi:MFS family permease